MRPLPLTSYSAKANCSFSSSVALAESGAVWACRWNVRVEEVDVVEVQVWRCRRGGGGAGLGGERREGAAELAEGERARLVLVVAGDHAAQQRVHRHLAHRAHLVGIDQPVAVAVEVAEALREDH